MLVVHVILLLLLIIIVRGLIGALLGAVVGRILLCVLPIVLVAVGCSITQDAPGLVARPYCVVPYQSPWSIGR
jgi:hypothetical protein